MVHNSKDCQRFQFNEKRASISVYTYFKKKSKKYFLVHFTILLLLEGRVICDGLGIGIVFIVLHVLFYKNLAEDKLEADRIREEEQENLHKVEARVEIEGDI